jgi:hypothetical protein
MPSGMQQQQKPSARKRRKGGIRRKEIIPFREAGSVFTRCDKSENAIGAEPKERLLLALAIGISNQVPLKLHRLAF